MRLSRLCASSAAERLEELAEILTAGLIRLQARQSSALFAHPAESWLHIRPARSGDGSPTNRRDRYEASVVAGLR
jgi:hypothetical protein